MNHKRLLCACVLTGILATSACANATSEPPAMLVQEVQSAQAAYDAGDYTTAISSWSRIIALSPEEGLYFCGRAQAYEQMDRIEEAYADIQIARSMGPASEIIEQVWLRLSARMEQSWAMERLWKEDGYNGFVSACLEAGLPAQREYAPILDATDPDHPRYVSQILQGVIWSEPANAEDNALDNTLRILPDSPYAGQVAVLLTAFIQSADHSTPQDDVETLFMALMDSHIAKPGEPAKIKGEGQTFTLEMQEDITVVTAKPGAPNALFR